MVLLSDSGEGSRNRSEEAITDRRLAPVPDIIAKPSIFDNLSKVKIMNRFQLQIRRGSARLPTRTVSDSLAPGPALNPNARALPAGSQKIQYTFCAKCDILSTACAGMGRPGQNLNRNTQKMLRAECPSTRRYRVKGDGAGRLDSCAIFAQTGTFERSLQTNWLKN